MAHGTEVYAICNHATGEAYIGQSGVAKFRFQQHWALLRVGKHHNRVLQAAWARDGAASFGFVVLERITYPDIKGAARDWAQEARWCARARAVGVALYNDRVGRRKAA